MRAYGHETDGVTRVPQEGDFLAAAAERLLAEGEEFTLADTAEWMTQTAGPTVYGKPWSPTTLRRRLLNPAVAGLRTNAEGELVEGPAEPLMARETYERLLERFARNRRAEDAKPRHVHLLSGGTAECQLSETPLVSRSTANGGRGYVCEASGCGKVRIAAAPLDQFIGERVLARVARPGSLARLAAVRDRFAEEARAAAETVEGLKGHKEELARAYGAKDLTLAEFKEAKKALEDRRGQAMAATRRGKYLDQLPELTVDGLVAWWNDVAGDEQRRTLVQLVIAKVVVGPAAVRGARRFDEGRIDIRYQ